MEKKREELKSRCLHLQLNLPVLPVSESIMQSLFTSGTFKKKQHALAAEPITELIYVPTATIEPCQAVEEVYNIIMLLDQQ